MSEETVTFNLEILVQPIMDNAQKIQTILYRTLGLWGKICHLLGIPEDSPILVIERKVQEVVMLARLLNSAITSFAIPGVGSILGAIGVASATLSFADMLAGY